MKMEHKAGIQKRERSGRERNKESKIK